MSDVAIAQILTFLTVVIGFVLQWLREQRQRSWDVQDRKELAAKVLATATEVETHVLDKATELHRAIAEGTTASKLAAHEANTVNLKLEKLGLEANALKRKELEGQ